eukprot:Tamp_19624.p2 GENE.Tamp_19624~~Tamp_19624.p2  ORF type:complete len:132 (+),score=34.13 Tamp_19624:585-980(+)
MRGLGAAQRSVLALARSVQGGLSGRGMASGAAGPVHTAIVRAVTEALEPVEVELVDDSASHAGHSGMKGRQAVESHFKLRVVSEKFEGVPLVKRHQMVYGLLEKEFKEGLHALNITAKTPNELAKAAAKSA